jgi:uncharacterized protein YprB with RNaseH-like and TPR domain
MIFVRWSDSFKTIVAMINIEGVIWAIMHSNKSDVINAKKLIDRLYNRWMKKEIEKMKMLSYKNN